MDAVGFLDAVAGYTEATKQTGSSDRPIRLATIAATYNPYSGYPSPPADPTVVFDGETDPSGKAYPYVQGFIPAPGQRVWMVPIGTTYLIAGAVGADTQGFYALPSSSTYRIEIGGGAYLEATSTGVTINGHSTYPNSAGHETVATAGTSDTIASTSFANLGGSGHSFSFTKQRSNTRLRIDCSHTFTVTNADTGAEFGVRINGTDYRVATLPGSLSLTHHFTASGVRHISGVPAGTYTVQGRWRRTNGTGTVTRDTNDWSSTSCMEVAP